MSGAGHGGRGNNFWDAARLKRLRAARAAGVTDRDVLKARFGVSKTLIAKGVAMLAAEDAAKAGGERA